ncbi:MAG: GGDEF domain-containing protein [Lachnospiraceae bacterium]|nr:GGDEF domain-containing protein [Lachnospiraceae bacterium]
MFNNGRKTIGVFAENMSSEVQHKVCDGIIREARAKGYNVALFSSQGSYGQSKLFCVGDLELYQLPPYKDLAGAILILDTMDDAANAQHVIKLVKERCQCPVVSIRMTIPGFNTVLVDNSTCMEPIIRHVIEFHKAKNICFMTGPEGHFDAIERLKGFMEVMKKYDLPVEDHQIFWGDFWKSKGAAACDHFLNGHEKPDAIICANDYMALAVTSELISRGYRVPDDIIVTGYDGLDYGLSFTPSITTAEAPFDEMGRESVDLIDSQQKDWSKPKMIYLTSKPCLRESCGCIKGQDINLMSIRRKQHENLQQGNHRSTVFSYMSTQLAEHSTMEGISDILSNYLQYFSHLRSYAICLNRNMSSDHKMMHYTEDMDVRTAYLNGEMIPRANIPFERKHLLPEIFTDEGPQAWYFLPLHFLDYCLGYEAFRFDDDHPAGITYFQFDVILCNNIYETLTYAKMQKMIEELQNSSLHDALTGLYNRGAFNTFGGQMFEEARELKKPLFVAVIDMDNLKVINDVHGHIEGDFALKRVAIAISKCCSDQFIFARTGGDEYYVIGQDMTEETGAQCLEEIDKALTKFNESKKKKYEIHASSGYYYDVPGHKDTLDDFVKVADRFMYHNKLENKKKRGEALR